MTNYQKIMGNRGESIVVEYYQKKGFDIIERNFTIHGGEIDIIAECDDYIVFVEVKTISQEMDLFNFLSKKKIATLKKTIEAYLRKYKIQKSMSLDIVFVMNGKVMEIYENVTN